VFGKIMRGELWEALAGIHNIRSDALLPMLDWTAGRSQEGYRRLDTRLDPGMAQRLEDALGLLEAGALYDALQAEISLFRDLCEPLFERFGSTYDRVPGEEIKDKSLALERAQTVGAADYKLDRQAVAETQFLRHGGISSYPGHSPCPLSGAAPSWPIRPSLSISYQRSTNRPFVMRSMLMPVTSTRWPVGARPTNSARNEPNTFFTPS
jgi:hypothetical protein